MLRNHLFKFCICFCFGQYCRTELKYIVYLSATSPLCFTLRQTDRQSFITESLSYSACAQTCRSFSLSLVLGLQMCITIPHFILSVSITFVFIPLLVFVKPKCIFLPAMAFCQIALGLVNSGFSKNKMFSFSCKNLKILGSSSVIEHLPSIHEPPSSTPCTIKNLKSSRCLYHLAGYNTPIFLFPTFICGLHFHC